MLGRVSKPSNLIYLAAYSILWCGTVSDLESTGLQVLWHYNKISCTKTVLTEMENILVKSRASMLLVDKHTLHIQHCNYGMYVDGREESIQHDGKRVSQKVTTRKTFM
jgi:hypothetical protein